MSKIVCLLLVLLVLALSTAFAQRPGKMQIEEQQGSAFVMDDNFEYTLLDYGVGQVQVRPTDKQDSLSPQVFWVKFRIANRDEHLIRQHKYISLAASGPLKVTDNWGNAYWLKHPEAAVTKYARGFPLGLRQRFISRSRARDWHGTHNT